MIYFVTHGAHVACSLADTNNTPYTVMQVVMKVRSQTWSWPLTLATVQNTPGLPSYVNTSSTARSPSLVLAY